MRKIKGVMLLLAIIFVFSNGVGCTTKQEDKAVDNIVQEEIDNDKEEIEKQDEEEGTEEEEVVNYKDLYNEEINSLIDKYGRFETESTGMIKGIKYGQLIDFDKDEIPEMIILHDRQVVLYTIKDGEVKCIYEGVIGARYGQTDVSYSFMVNDDSENPSLIVPHSEKEWIEEKITIVTVEDGEAKIKELYAKVDELALDANMFLRETLIEFFIDNQNVTKDEYNNIYNSIVKEAKNIDACWNYESATSSELEAFINSLK